MKSQFKKEQDLLHALQSKSPTVYNAALKHLYDSDPLRNAVRKEVFFRGGNEGDVSAVLNEALCTVFNQVQNGIYNPALSKLTTYIVGVAKQQFFTKQRSKSRLSAKHERSAEGENVETSFNLSEEMDRAEQKALLAKVLTDIDPRCQKLTELQSIGYSMAEIAVQMAYKNQDVAKMAAKDCREKFRKHLEKRPDLVAEILGL